MDCKDPKCTFSEPCQACQEEYAEAERRREYERAVRKQKDEDKARELVNTLGDALNVLSSNRDFENAFVRAITSGYTHRSLQQKIAQLFIMVFEQWAKDGESGRFDLRNEDTVEAAKKIMEALKDHGFRLI